MSHLDRLMVRAQRNNIPISAMFELTGRCNLDCGHCYLDIAHPPREMSTAEALHVIDELAESGTLWLVLTGGEIFLRADTLEIAAYARRRGLAVRLLTNATRIDRGLAAAIARVNPMAVEVSIYGAHGATHEGVTARRRTLRRTLRGVLHLVRAGVNVGLKAPLLQPVTGELDRLYAVADRIGVPISFDPFVTPRIDGADAPLALRADSESLARALAHPRLGLAQKGLPGPADPDDAPCALARRTVRIAPTGDVYPCSTYPVPVGNLLRQRFRDLWAGGELLDKLRGLRMRDLEGACHGCGQSGYCSRCTAVALIEHGRELGPSEESCRLADAQERALGVRRGPTEARVKLRIVS